MAFITKTDLLDFIESDQMTVVSQADDTAITRIIAMAEEEAKGYMRHHYDVAAIFSASGSGRDNKLIQVVSQIALYHLFVSAVPRNIPEIRKEMYDGNGLVHEGSAIGWLKAVQKGMVTMDLPTATDDDGEVTGHRVQYGNRTTDY